MFVYRMNNMADNAVNQEFSKICAEHPGCEGCPLKGNSIDVQGVKVVCETGQFKKETTA